MEVNFVGVVNTLSLETTQKLESVQIFQGINQISTSFLSHLVYIGFHSDLMIQECFRWTQRI